MEKETSTYSNQEVKPLTIEDVKRCCEAIVNQKEAPLPKGLGWFTRLMARFGWHREYELLVMDRTRIHGGLYPIKGISNLKEL